MKIKIIIFISFFSAGVFADSLVRRNIISLTNVRKLFNSLTSFTSAACMVVLCFCDQTQQILGVATVFVFLVVSGKLFKNSKEKIY